ncbi:ferric reductase-like protein [Grosmannia clavigera kw1407]|uniref:Ferric reductase-like protein n=1 Tax=Grosmannia clavigera (strain kw1407 / UAMH 11150) TaxID=655863 RepID=F0XNB8_GROCL|nr:ferric reductase-like protein [Grosmannia clavigera kw1407]EFX00918.1 ferric reductase-like protein [Grosmannia clavigera kw1407]
MGWPYAFMQLSAAEVEARRAMLDRYGHYTVMLSVLPVVVMLAMRLIGWTAKQVQRRLRVRSRRGGGNGSSDDGEYGAVPTSPTLKSRRQTAGGSWAARQRRLRWWLSTEVEVHLPWSSSVMCLGPRDQWLVGLAWTVAVVVLCTAQTGGDFLHVTKRCGIVAVALLPAQYVLALRRISPLTTALGGFSHEQLNRWHRLLGGIVYGLLAVHTTLYLVFFARAPGGTFWPRFARPVVWLGFAALAAMTLLSTTALEPVRRWSYRVFFVVHVTVAVVLPPIVWLHTHHARPYVAAALLFLVVDVAVRRARTMDGDGNGTAATVVAIPGTDLVRLTVPLPAAKLSLFRDRPGSHVYVSVPSAGRPRAWMPFLLFELLFNPFTVAAVSEPDHSLSLVVRTRNGPMTGLLAERASRVKHVEADNENIDDDDDDDDDDDMGEDVPVMRNAATTASSSSAPSPDGLVHLSIDGPYGAAAHFPDLSAQQFDHVLLVAGGVGATFVVPIYRALVHDGSPSPSPKVDLVWAVRTACDATWAVVSGQDGSNILADPNVHIFLTGGRQENNGGDAASDMELSSLRHRPTAGSHGRPDFRPIVDNLFHRGAETRVAVIVCGPRAMVRDLRAVVGLWVQRGRSIWWHDEAFGW